MKWAMLLQTTMANCNKRANGLLPRNRKYRTRLSKTTVSSNVLVSQKSVTIPWRVVLSQFCKQLKTCCHGIGRIHCRSLRKTGHDSLYEIGLSPLHVSKGLRRLECHRQPPLLCSKGKQAYAITIWRLRILTLHHWRWAAWSNQVASFQTEKRFGNSCMLLTSDGHCKCCKEVTGISHKSLCTKNEIIHSSSWLSKLRKLVQTASRIDSDEARIVWAEILEIKAIKHRPEPDVPATRRVCVLVHTGKVI